jgi:urea transport system ATP-binding protein
VAFGDFVAIPGLSFIARYGEIHAVIGPNGAGKTTLCDVITGKTRPRAGKVLLDGRIDLRALDEPAIALAGVGRKFQKPSVFEALTVRENLELALRLRPRSILAETPRLGRPPPRRPRGRGARGGGARRPGRGARGRPRAMDRSRRSRSGCC